jgi:hypothetical protein
VTVQYIETPGSLSWADHEVIRCLQHHELLPGTISSQSNSMDTRRISGINSIAISGTANTTIQARLAQGTCPGSEANKTGSASASPRPLEAIGFALRGSAKRGCWLKGHDLEVVKLTIWADDWPFPRLMATCAYCHCWGVSHNNDPLMLIR